MSTALFDMVVNADPKTLDIHFDRGWSVRPGRIHATNLSIRNRDGSYEWILHIREVQFNISFLALIKQRFQVSNVHGVGGSFRMRSRLDPSQVTPERLAGIPPIDGFPAVPIRPFQQCAVNEWDDARYHLWTVQLEDVHADAVREIWFDRYRLDGETSATGRFYLKPVRAVEVGPIHSEMRDMRPLGRRQLVGRGARQLHRLRLAQVRPTDGRRESDSAADVARGREPWDRA